MTFILGFSNIGESRCVTPKNYCFAETLRWILQECEKILPMLLITGPRQAIWLVVLRLNVPVNNFSVMSGRSHRFLGN